MNETTATTELSDRVAAPISTAELERRWSMVRTAMEAAGIDVLVMQNNNDHVGGYVKYFSDTVPAGNGYPLSVVFPREGLMTVIGHGAIGDIRSVPTEGDGVLRGVERVLSTASFASAPYTRYYDAELTLKALEGFSRATIGLVGTTQMSAATAESLRKGLPQARFVEASDIVDRIKIVKSAEELDRIRAAARIQDTALAAAFAEVEPGRRDSDIAAIAQHVSQQLGSEQGIYLACSFAPGTPAFVNHRHYQNRIMREGDVFALLVECNGPGGYYAELGRMCVLGAAPPELLEEHAFMLEAQRHTLDLLVPGTPAADIWEAHNAFMVEHGRAPETRIHCHGQGYDLVERPLIRFDETVTIEANMNITCHPSSFRNGFAAWTCDNYLVGTDGSLEPIHATKPDIVEI